MSRLGEREEALRVEESALRVPVWCPGREHGDRLGVSARPSEALSVEPEAIRVQSVAHTVTERSSTESCRQLRRYSITDTQSTSIVLAEGTLTSLTSLNTLRRLVGLVETPAIQQLRQVDRVRIGSVLQTTQYKLLT